MGGDDSETPDARVCIILDHRKSNYVADKDKAKLLFKNVFGYQIKEIEIPENIDSEGIKFDGLFSPSEYNYKAIILLVFGECDPKKIGPDHYKEVAISQFVDSDMYLFQLNNLFGDKIPKILIQHMWHNSYPPPKSISKKTKVSNGEDVGGVEDVRDPKSNTFRVFSTIIDDRGEFSDQPAMFIESMDTVFRQFAGKCDIIELFTKVCRDVEISQYNTINIGQVRHRVNFTHHELTGFGIEPVHSVEESSVCPTEVDQPTTKYQDTLLSQYGKHVYNEQNSVKDLKKIPTMRIELKRQKLPNPVGKYPMDHKPRGFCLIINMSNTRTGSFVDELRMHQLFTELSFETIIINNRRHNEIKEEVKRLSEQVTKHHQCLFVLLMAHGSRKNDHLFGDVCGEEKESNYIFDRFNTCENLIGKPKVYVIQTCFGSESMMGIQRKNAKEIQSDYLEDSMRFNEVDGRETESDHGEYAEIEDDDWHKDNESMSSFRSNVPHEISDVFRLHATIDGFKSYRSASHGAIVFQAIDKLFRDYAAEHDVVHLMTMVTAYVAEETFNEDEKQQPISNHTFRSILFLNPGYTEPKYPHLPIKETGFSVPDYEVDASKTLQGSVCWNSGNYIIVASNTSSTLQKTRIQGDHEDEKSFKPDTQSLKDIRGILSGLMLADDEHIIVYIKLNGERKIVIVKLDRGTEKWCKTMDLTDTIDSPLTMCEINNDCFGVLLGTPNTHESATIEVYKRSAVLTNRGNVSTPIQAENVIRVKYASKSTISLRDKICYSHTKFYLLSFYESTVYQVNIHGKKENLRSGFDSTPVALLRGPNGSIDVACAREVYTEAFGHSQKRSPEICTNWFAGEYIGVVGNTRSMQSVIHVQERGIENILTNFPIIHDELCDPLKKSNMKDVLSEFMLSKDEHVVIYNTTDEARKITAITRDQETKRWSKIIDLTTEIGNPLKICEIYNDCCAVLRGTPDTQAYITIDIYTINELRRIMKKTSKSTIRAKCVFRVNCTTDTKVSLRDQIWYSRSNFYIFSFDASVVYQLTINGKKGVSTKNTPGPVAILKGPDDKINIACTQDMYKDIFGQNEKAPLSESYPRWSADKYVVHFTSDSDKLELIPIQDTENRNISIELGGPKYNIVKGIRSGLMLSGHEHIIIHTTPTGEQEIGIAALNNKTITWRIIANLTGIIPNPISLCEIDQDCFGVLRRTPNSDEQLTVEVYSRKDILQWIEKAKSPTYRNLTPDVNKKKFLFKVDNADQRDQICYSEKNFYISSFSKSVIYKVNENGVQQDTTGVDSAPMVLLRGPHGTIDVVCSGQKKYTDVFGEKKKVESTDIYPRWSADTNVVICSDTNDKIRLADESNKQIDMDCPTYNMASVAKGILSGCMLSEDKHLITYVKHDGSPDIVVAVLDKDRKKWDKIDFPKPIANPLTVCEINDDCIGVLCGIQNTDNDVTIEVYTREEIQRYIKKTSKPSKTRAKESVAIRAIVSIQVNYAIGSKIDIRDQICYSNGSFYILSFEQSTVHQVNISASLQRTNPVALLKGPAETTYIACCKAGYSDVFNQKKVRLAENYASYMLKRQDKAVVMFDPGLDFGTFPLIPKFQLQNDCEIKAICLQSNYKYQCVWPTNTQGVVAVGSAESCHISLAKCNDNIAKTTTYLGGFDKPAKIVQGIYLNCHLNEETHLVLFDVNVTQNWHMGQMKKILKLITINLDSEEIVMNISKKNPGNSNTTELLSIENPVALFIVDGNTFGVLCKINGSDELKMFHRKQLKPVKDVKLQKSCVGSENVSACVNAHGEFYISDYSKHEVNQFDVNGLHKRTLFTNTLDPYRVMVDEDNEIFILCQDAIYRFNDDKFVEAFKFGSQSQDDIRQSTGETEQDTNKEKNTKQSWDVCFFGNLMYSVFEKTLDVYETSKGALKTTIDSLAQKQKPSEVETTGQNAQEITGSPTTATSPATTTGDAMDTDLCTRI